MASLTPSSIWYRSCWPNNSYRHCLILYVSRTKRRSPAYVFATASRLLSTSKDNPYVDDVLALSFENAAITDLSALDMMGAKMEPIDNHNEAALRRNFLKVFETADNIVVMFSYMGIIYSDERTNEFSEVLASVTNKMIEVTDPSSITIDEILS